MTDLAQPWPDGQEPGNLGDTEMGTVKAPGGECARVWPDGPPGHDYWLGSPVPVPVAAFTYAPPAPTTTTLVTFDGSSSQPAVADAIITSYAWLFNNQTTRSGVTCTWRLPSAHGSYDATLTITDTTGGSDSVTQALVI
jgi:PKD repeat protein